MATRGATLTPVHCAPAWHGHALCPLAFDCLLPLIVDAAPLGKGCTGSAAASERRSTRSLADSLSPTTTTCDAPVCDVYANETGRDMVIALPSDELEVGDASLCSPSARAPSVRADSNSVVLIPSTKDDIDDLFGWLQAERAKDQQKAYAGIAERSVRARCTIYDDLMRDGRVGPDQNFAKCFARYGGGAVAAEISRD